MKWKDTGDLEEETAAKRDPYYEDDGYSSFKDKRANTGGLLSNLPGRLIYWIGGGAVLVLLIALLLATRGGSDESAHIQQLEERLDRFEQLLAKYEGVDEKVTRIWEEAQSFEAFKTRFDRSEASMSLRMDHLAMSLDALQKKTDDAMKKIQAVEKAPAQKPPVEKPPVEKPTARAADPTPPSPPKKGAEKIHTVAAGDTLFNISQRYQLSVEQLRKINQLPEGAVIHVGQKLKVSAP